MAQSLFSPSWYRVAKLKPRLRGHTQIYRHEYRGELWYVLQDHAKGRYYRFSPAAYYVIGLMNGDRTVQTLWEMATDQLGDDAPTQNDVVHLLAQLHSADVLLGDVPTDTAELLRRSERIDRTSRVMKFRSPLAVRIPLIDPEKFLRRTAHLVRPIFSVWGLLVWVAVVVTGAVLAGSHFPELTENIVDRVLTAQNLLVMWFAYPLVKALHELGHAYAVKTWGGEVHEMGIMFLVFMPIPFVDASAASEFRARYRRVIVGAAGIFVELFLASVALAVWVNLEPGLLRTFAFNVVLIGSVSSLVFNANPLLRFDGYYILADLVEIPNLAQRGLKYLGYLMQRYVFRVKGVKPPYTGPGERFWLVFHSVASFIYRIFIYASIVLFVAGKFFFIGVLLAAWAIFSMLVMPLGKAVKFIIASPILRERRPRAVLIGLGTVAAIALALFVLPVPSRTRAEGVVWVPPEAMIRAGTDGFVHRIAAQPGDRVAEGQLIVECRDPLLAAKAEVLRALMAELDARRDAAMTADRVQVAIIDEERAAVLAGLERIEERVAELDIRSAREGILILPDAQNLPGHFLRQGDLIAYVLEPERPTVRVVVPQSNVDLVRRRTDGVEVRLADRLREIFPASVLREVPQGDERLPSTVLSQAGGGEIVVDPLDERGPRAFEKLFQFDLQLGASLDDVFVGSRAYVRFDHGTEPVAYRWYRGLRRVLLRRFNV